MKSLLVRRSPRDERSPHPTRWARLAELAARHRPVTAVVGVLALVALWNVPLFFSEYLVHIGTLVLISVPLALGQNLITGNSGQVSMGHAALYGLGAYVAAILAVTYQWPAFGVIAAAIGAAGLVGMLVALPAVRLSGDYLFIVTIGVNLVFIDVVTQWVPVTGGSVGIAGLPVPSFAGLRIETYVGYYHLALVAAALATLVTIAITRSRFGTVVEAVRDDPMAAAACGVGLTTIRLSVFVIGAALAGLSGSLLAYFIGFIGPQDFTVIQSLLIFEMAIVGGLGSVRGSVIGAVLMIGIPELLRPLQPYRLGLGGLLIILLMLYRPQGVFGKVKVTNLIKK